MLNWTVEDINPQEGTLVTLNNLYYGGDGGGGSIGHAPLGGGGGMGGTGGFGKSRGYGTAFAGGGQSATLLGAKGNSVISTSKYWSLQRNGYDGTTSVYGGSGATGGRTNYTWGQGHAGTGSTGGGGFVGDVGGLPTGGFAWNVGGIGGAGNAGINTGGGGGQGGLYHNRYYSNSRYNSRYYTGNGGAGGSGIVMIAFVLSSAISEINDSNIHSIVDDYLQIK